MRVLVTGVSGQIGKALMSMAPDDYAVTGADRSVLELREPEIVRNKVQQLAPEIVIHAAAYTAVDRAESEREMAFRINADATREIARACEILGSRMLYVSTDYVFDGTGRRPYMPEDETNPINAYGASKRAGEQAVLDVLKDKGLVLRTAWVHASGGRNFFMKMLDLMREKKELNVVCDQVGCPSWAPEIARVLWKLAAVKRHAGIYHWTDAGVASWYDCSIALQEEATALGLLNREVRVRPIYTEDFPTPARRPAWSVLDSRQTVQITGVSQNHWRSNLRNMLKEVKHA